MRRCSLPMHADRALRLAMAARIKRVATILAQGSSAVGTIVWLEPKRLSGSSRKTQRSTPT